MSSDVNEQLNQYLETWKNETENVNVVTILSKISDLIEKETESYLKMDPDPFDDRHPSRSKPTCSLGPLLKNLFKNDDFMNKLVNDYLMSRDERDLQVASCRLILDILPGLETSVVFNDTDGLLDRLFAWARNPDEPLQSYSTGLLAAAMDVQDIAAHSKEQNAQTMPIMLKKLKALILENSNEPNHIEEDHQFIHCSPFKKRRISSPSNDCSNSSWAEMEPLMIGSTKIYPLSNEISQRFIYQYLTSLGVYQDLLSFVFEHNVLSMILTTIDWNKNGDVRLAFDALKYLASLLCHKKFALEFVNSGGIQCLLKVYRQSVAANGVSYCLNCIAYHDDVMEKICFLPRHVINELVSYALWLIETSHDSSRSNAMIFFSLTFSYRMILELFDSQDGLRKILNEISMIDLFSPNTTILTEDEIFTKRQYAKHVCFALKRYFEAHLIIKTQSMIKSNTNSTYDSASLARLKNINVPAYKTINYDYDLFMEHVEALLHMMPIRCHWAPVDELIKYGGAKLLIQYISLSYDWNFSGKADAVRSALDVLVVCTVMSKFQTILCDNIKIGEENNSTVGMRIVLAAASGEIVNDPDSQRSALNVIINCVCGPINRIGGSIARVSMGSAKKKSFRGGEDILNKMWNCLRFNNGIMSLINLLMIKTPITDADSIRALSCKALCGLARSEAVRQVIGKLPLFTNGQIQALMKEPILQDKRNEHIKFCKYCIELIERVTGSPVIANLEASVDNLNKAEVITQTKIVFNEQELLQLLYKHLVQKGLSKTAQMLIEEANLSHVALNNLKTNFKFTTPPRSTVPRVSRQISILSQNSNTFPSISPQLNLNNSLNISQTPVSTNSIQPIKLQRANKNRVNNSSSTNSTNISNRRQSFHFNSPMAKRKTDLSSSAISLDSIVIEYLRKQHALCKNPVVTCPPFDLFKPHRCPEPKNRNVAPVNIAARILNRQAFPPSGGMFGSKMDRKFIYSRFRPYRSLRCFDPTNFLYCAFSYTGNLLYVGTDSGDIHVFNYITGEIENTYPCYDTIVAYIEPSWDGKMALTCSYWEQPNSILWSMGDTLEEKYTFAHDNHVEFGKAVQDKALGTQEFTAHLYDLNTCQLVRTFEDENYSNQYAKNIATFHPSDLLILNDGVLWDVRAEKPIHKFDKFNQTINGIFHPNGQEIVSNSEIWDIKTFNLLKTVPALSQSYVKFNRKGDVIYAVYEDETADELDEKMLFSSSFRTFDGHDYSNIATIDVKRPITALAIDPSDSYIAIIENQCNRDNSIYSQDKLARLYEIGRCREEDDEDRDDDEDDGGDEESGDSYDDDDLMDNDMLSSGSELSVISDMSDGDSDNFDSDTSHASSDDEEDEVYYQLNN